MSGRARHARSALLVAPVLPLAWALRSLRRRRVARRRGAGDGGGGGWPPPDGGVREPRRPKPNPSAGVMAIEEDGEAVQA